MFSIHASAKEATSNGVRIYQKTQSFQSTPPRRRRLVIDYYSLTEDNFQSTPPRRRRRRCVACFKNTLDFFNPRLREGGDPDTPVSGRILTYFQSTPPRRRRRLMSDIKEATQVFNPRLREGGDRPDRQTVFRGVFSIHASAKEATSGAMTPIYYWRFSIHASAKEATI